jgi:hypothetical protein
LGVEVLWVFKIIETSMQITNIFQIELSLNHSQVFKAQILKMSLHSPFGDRNLSYDQKNDEESKVLGPSLRTFIVSHSFLSFENHKMYPMFAF